MCGTRTCKGLKKTSCPHRRHCDRQKQRSTSVRIRLRTQNANAVEPVEVLSQLAQAEQARAQAQIASLSLDQVDGEYPVRRAAISWFLRASCCTATVVGKTVSHAACAVCSYSRSCETGASLSLHTASWKVSNRRSEDFSWEKTRRIVAEHKTEQFRSKRRVEAVPRPRSLSGFHEESDSRGQL